METEEIDSEDICKRLNQRKWELIREVRGEHEDLGWINLVQYGREIAKIDMIMSFMEWVSFEDVKIK